MAPLFIDGFSHYANADFLLKWTVQTAGAITAGQGRFGTACYRFTTGAARINKDLTFGDNRSILGFGWRSSAIGSTGGTNMVELTSSGTVAILPNSNGSLTVSYPGGSTSTAAGLLSSNVYYHIGLEVFHSASVGTILLQLNGVDAIALTTGLNTGTTPATNVQFRQVASTTNTDICDLYVLDGTGSSPRNALLGDCKIETLNPTAEGNSSAWTPSSGSDNAAMVDDTTPDGDTTYVVTDTPGTKDTHVTADLSTSGGTVYAVQTILHARKTDATVRTLAPVIRQGGTDYDGTAVALATTYAQYRQIYPQDPTSTNWSISNVNSDEWGYKLVS